MPRTVFGILIAVAATCLGISHSRAQTDARFIPPPMSVPTARFYQAHQDAYARLLARLPQPGSSSLLRRQVVPASAGAWTAVTKGPPGLCNPLLMHDATVIAHVCDSKNWVKLTPDANGNYATGTWTQIASFPVIGGTQYAPQYNASSVLPDGRVIVMGGEYNNGKAVWTNLGAIYDPVANSWTAVTAPAGWTQIGDAESTVLANGTYLLASCCSYPDADALLNASTLTWTTTGAPAGGAYQDEQGYELLPTGNVLTVDVWSATTNPTSAELYNASSGVWGATGSTPVSLVDSCGTYEIGPAVLRANGTVVGFGGNTGCNNVTADPTAVYSSSTGVWTSGPNVPSICGSDGATGCDLADAPAAFLPNGNVLFAASAGYGGMPTHFFEYSAANAITQVSDPLDNSTTSGAYYYNFLVLPTGQVLMTDFSNTAELFTPSGKTIASNAPVVTKGPTKLVPGTTYSFSGTQLNGVTQGAYYGDDAQADTNYPIVKITNTATGHVFYAPTSNYSTMSVAPGTAGSASFTVPTGTETGASTLTVIASGAASKALSVTVK